MACKQYNIVMDITDEQFEAIMEAKKENYYRNTQNSNTTNNNNINNEVEEENISNNKFTNFLYSAMGQTILIMFISFLNGYLVQGSKYILPKTLIQVNAGKNIDYMEIVTRQLELASFSSAVCCFFAGFLMESVYFQRLRLFKILACCSSMIAYSAFSIYSQIDILACILKGILKIQDHAMDIYSAETFETKKRVLYLSISNILCSFSMFVSPFVNDIITEYWYRLNYLIFGIVASVVFLSSLTLKKEKYKTIID
jgi:MFS family permease